MVDEFHDLGLDPEECAVFGCGEDATHLSEGMLEGTGLKVSVWVCMDHFEEIGVVLGLSAKARAMLDKH